MPPMTRRSSSKVFFDSPAASSSSSAASSDPQSAPLRATKVVASIASSNGSNKRIRVAFSPNNHTKVFNSNDPLIPDSSEPPASVRRYPTSPPSSSPPSSSRGGGSPLTSREGTPSLRSILKANAHSIRLAKCVKEGTWNNREPARLLVTGNQPTSSRRDTMMLAQLCDTAEDGVAATPSRPPDDEPGSDDSNSSSDGPGSDEAQPGGDAEEEEEEEEPLYPTSLVGIILDGAEDLLTLEEAYNALTLRVREAMFDMGPVTLEEQSAFETVLHPIRQEAPAMVRAMQRDLHRLMGKVPNLEADTGSSPFRGLINPSPQSRLPPSPDRTPRKGYTAAEVLYRREAASVGSATLRFLACVFSSPRLFQCFTEADLLALLDQVLLIPRAPTLPTPSPKRTYTLAMVILAHLRLPLAWVRQVQDKIVRALESGLSSIGVAFALKDPTPIRKEAFNAVSILLKAYPDVFFSSYANLLPTCLRTLHHGMPTMRKCASGAAAAFVATKLRLIEDSDLALRNGGNKDEWSKTRATITKSETFVTNFLKSALKAGGKFIYDAAGEKRTEWSPIESTFRATVGSADEVAWACSTWATIVSLMGQTYNSSTQLPSIDHIMNRSLQPSTNVIRPTLASAAWQHAVYAYLLAGSTEAVTDGRVVRSYNAFVASQHQDVNARLKTICLPVNLALSQANSASNWTKALTHRPEFNGEERWTWQRSEKARKLAWLVTCGMQAPAIVFAYSLLALEHEDPSARTLTRTSGLPSSDGAVADLSPEEHRLPRLDRTFDLVLMPLLKQFFTINGVDSMKNLGWEIFEAVTAAPGKEHGKLERLLSPRYLDCEVVGIDKVTLEAIATFESDRVTAAEIPAWGKLWVAKRLGKLLALFHEAFEGIRGISDLEKVEWVTNADGLVLLPATLSRIWANLLRGLLVAYIPDAAPTPLYVVGLQAIYRQLMAVFDSDPATYIPLCLLNSAEQSVLNPDAIRLGISLHLYTIAVDILGESALGGVRINLSQLGGTTAEEMDGNDAFGHPTVVGHLLCQLLRTKLLASPMDAKVRSLFQQFVGTLLKAGSTRQNGTRLLGEVTNAMPWIFEGHEQLQLDVWRLVALRWAEVLDVQPSESQSASATNHTGSLLVSLLSGPFRTRGAASIWYTAATPEDLGAWDALLKVTVLRFRAKHVGSNFGVLETLAAHLDDFIRVDDDDAQTTARRQSATMLHCLAVATSWISLVRTEHHHASHFSINENYVPVDFLTLVGDALLEAFPASESETPHATVALIIALTDLFGRLPPDAVEDVLAPLRPAMLKWMDDTQRVLSPEVATVVDSLYVAHLGALASAIEGGALPATSETMNTFVDMYAPRLSRAQSAAVPAAFQDFWRRCFQIDGLEYSDDVAGFLRDVLTAVPGLIVVHGLDSDESDSVAAFPFAESVPSQVTEDGEREETALVEPTHIEQDEAMESRDEPVQDPVALEAEATPARTRVLTQRTPDDSTAYDADVSQGARGTKRRASELVAQSSPEESPDVFGPKRRGRARKNARKRRETRTSEEGDTSVEVQDDASPASDAHTPEHHANTTIIAETPITSHAPQADIPDDDYVDESLLHEHDRAWFSSASRWLRKVPSIGALFSGSESPTNESRIHPEDDSPAAVRSRKRKRRDDEHASHIAPERPSASTGAAPDTTVAEPEAQTPEDAAPEPPRIPRTRSRTSRANADRSLTSTPTPSEASSTASTPADDTPRTRRGGAKRRRRRRSEADDEDEVLEAAARAAREEEEEVAREEAKAREEEERRVREEEERAAREEEERLAREEKERLAREEEERLAREEEERREEEARQETAARLAREEEERLAHEEEARIAREEEARLAREDAARVAREEAARLAQEKAEAERLAREEEAARRALEEAEAARLASEKETTPEAAVQESGVFDDAPGDETPKSPRRSPRRTRSRANQTPPVEPASPASAASEPPSPRRTTAQSRVLDMVAEAARHENAIASLGFTDVVELLANIDRLRAAATANLTNKAEEGRRKRRRT